MPGRTSQEEKPENKYVEIVLSIILAASLPEALNIVIKLGGIAWFIFSILYILGVIAIIFKIMEGKSEGWEQFFKLLSIVSFSLLPFFVNKLLGMSEKSTENIYKAIICMLGTAFAFLLWGLYEWKIKKRKITLFSISLLVLIFLIIFYALIDAGLISI